MKRIVLVVLAVLALAGGGLWLVVKQALPTAVPAALDAVQAAKAQEFLATLDRGEWAAAEAMLQPQTREKLANGLLETVWTSLPKQLGERRGVGAPRGEAIGDKRIVTMRLDFAKFAVDARIGFAADGLIDGFRIVPAQADPAPPPPADAPYAEVDAVVGDLPATLAMPRDARGVPGVVLVHGSGAHDRDETIGPNRPFLDLARGLAARGVAVLRYEKRNKVHADAFAGAYTVDDETTNDALAAAAALRATAGVDARRVYVLGHSLGAMMGPRMLARDAALAGAVLVAAPSRRLEDTVVRQYRHLSGTDGEVTADEAAAIAKVVEDRDAVRAVDATTPPDRKLMLGVPASYWLDLREYDPVAAAGGVAQPILVLHGDRDYQVDEGDFTRWAVAFADSARVTLKRYPELNHLMMAGVGPGTPDEYFRPGHVDARVVEDVASWVLAGPGAATPAAATSAKETTP